MGKPEELFQETLDFFDGEGIRYSIINREDNFCVLRFAPSSFKDDGGIRTKVFIDFDEREESDGSVTVHFASLSAAKCEDDRVPEAMVRINEMNKRYRWIKFWFDPNDNTINVDADAIVFTGSVGKECKQYAMRMSNILEDALIDMKDIFPASDDDGGDAPSPDELRSMLEALMALLGDSE